MNDPKRQESKQPFQTATQQQNVACSIQNQNSLRESQYINVSSIKKSSVIWNLSEEYRSIIEVFDTTAGVSQC